MNRNIEFFAELSHFGRHIALHMALPMSADSEHRTVARQVVFEKVEENSCLPSPLEISIRSAQSLMDQLWNCGLRPSEGSGSAGALAATQNHLKDMQEVSRKLMDSVLSSKSLE